MGVGESLLVRTGISELTFFIFYFAIPVGSHFHLLETQICFGNLLLPGRCVEHPPYLALSLNKL